MKRAVPRERVCLFLCSVQRRGIPAALAHGLHAPSGRPWARRSQTPTPPCLQTCNCLPPKPSKRAPPLPSSCGLQPNQSSWAARPFVSVMARRAVLWSGTWCGYLEKRKQREHGVDRHMGALRNRRRRAAGGQQARAIAMARAVRCGAVAGGGRRARGCVSRGVTWSAGLVEKRAPEQRWWYTQANARARRRARS